MHPREYKPRKSVVRMDPDCAICHAPASHQCDCEAKGLEVAVRQAEQRMMQSMYSDIRAWVRAHAQDYILEYFRLLTERRKAQHAQHMERLQAHAYQYYQSSPHPAEIAQAQAGLKRGIDEDWQASVQRYPEVLEYFYGLVVLTFPDDDESAVKDPPLSALNGSHKMNRRSAAATLANESYHERDRPAPLTRGRTPPAIPPPGRRSGRTTAPPMSMYGAHPPPLGANRMSYRPHPGSYYGGPTH